MKLVLWNHTVFMFLRWDKKNRNLDPGYLLYYNVLIFLKEY